MDPLGKQGAHELLLLPGHRLESRRRVGPGDAQGEHVGVGGEEPEYLGQVQDARHLLSLPDDEALDAVARHQQEGIEQIALQWQTYQRSGGQHRQRRGERQSLEGEGVEQGLAGRQAQAAVGSGVEQAVGALGHHGFGGGQQGQAAVDDERRLQVAWRYARQDELRQVLLPELAAALLLPLAIGQGGGEVAGDVGVLVTQGQKDGAGNELAEGVFQRGEAVAAASVELGTDVEHVPLAIVAKRLVGGRLFHSPLDDEVEALGLVPRALHRLAGAKVADAEVPAETLAGLVVQAVERRAGKIEQ